MAAPVYTVPFFVGRVPQDGTITYTPPEGTEAVLLELDARNETVAVQVLYIAVALPGTASFVVVQLNSTALGESLQWQGRIGLAGGHVLEITAGFGNWSVAATGYQFSSAPTPAS